MSYSNRDSGHNYEAWDAYDDYDQTDYDDYDTDAYEDYEPTRRDRLVALWGRVSWTLWRQWQKCPTGNHRNRDCNCIPF